MKYYVTSSQLQVVLNANDPIDAACKAIAKEVNRSDAISLDYFVYVSEHGFVNNSEFQMAEGDKTYLTKIILDKFHKDYLANPEAVEIDLDFNLDLDVDYE